MSGESRAGQAPVEGRVGIRAVQQHADPRGVVFEPLPSAEIAGQRNAHVVLTEPGCVRGNHAHTRGTEVLVVRGPASVAFRDADGRRDVEVPQGDVLAFTIPAGVPHAVVNTGTETSLIVAFRDVEHDPAAPDTRPEELLTPRR